MNYSICQKVKERNRESFSTQHNEHHSPLFLTIIGWDCRLSMCRKRDRSHFIGVRKKEQKWLISCSNNKILSIFYVVLLTCSRTEHPLCEVLIYLLFVPTDPADGVLYRHTLLQSITFFIVFYTISLLHLITFDEFLFVPTREANTRQLIDITAG